MEVARFIKSLVLSVDMGYFIDQFDVLFQDVFTGFLNKIIVAVIILLIGFIIAKVLSRLIERGFKELKISKVIKEISGIKISFEEIVSTFVLYFVYFLSIIMALRHIGIATDVLNLLSAAIILILGVFIILTVKDFIPNVISGIIIHQKSIINKGENITFNNITGKVIEITLLDTKIKTKSGDIIIIPNSNLTKREIIKKSRKK